MGFSLLLFLRVEEKHAIDIVMFFFVGDNRRHPEPMPTDRELILQNETNSHGINRDVPEKLSK
jgi:hypothetical protein